MSVPDFQSLTLPILRITSDRQEHTSSAASDLLAQQFNLNVGVAVEESYIVKKIDLDYFEEA